MKNLKQQTMLLALIAALCIPFNGLSQRGSGNKKQNSQNHSSQHHKKPSGNNHHNQYRNPHHNQNHRYPNYRKPHHRPHYRPRPVRTYHYRPVVRRPAPPIQFYGMQPNIFQSLQRNIQNAYFDNERLEIAKIAISNNGVNTNQVIDLMARLSFDKNKLELAKFAYDYVVNPEEYFQVIEGLSFYSNRRALSDYLR